MNLDERLDIEAAKLSGPDIGKKIKTKKVLVYITTALGGTLVEREVEEEDETN